MPSLHPPACFRLYERTLNHKIACAKIVTIAPHLWEHPTHGSIHGKYYQEVDNQADNQEGQRLHRVLAQSHIWPKCRVARSLALLRGSPSRIVSTETHIVCQISIHEPAQDVPVLISSKQHVCYTKLTFVYTWSDAL